jgi:hypothetical protein
MFDMQEDDKYRLLNLSYFANALLLPRLEFASRQNLGVPFETAKTAALFEVVSWLRLGTELRFFSEDTANQLFTRYMDELIPPNPKAWQGLKSLLSEQGDLLKLIEARATDTLAVRGSGEQPFDRPSELLPLFRSTLLLGSNIAGDHSAWSFTLAMGFLPDVPWKEFILDFEIDPSQVALAEGIGPADSSPYIPELVYAGFFRALDYMDALRTLFEDCADRQSLGVDVPRLRSRVLNIIGWRFNARANRQRFFELVEKVNAELGREMVKRGLNTSADHDVFRDKALLLMRYWNEEEEMMVHGASARS